MNKEKNVGILTEEYKCPNCGARVDFDPESQTLSCDYCHTKLRIGDDNNAEEKNLEILLKDTPVWQDVVVVECKNCGSKEVKDKGEISLTCSFCGTNNVVKTDEIVGMTPHGICPFTKTVEDCKDNVLKWTKSRKFVPNSFKNIDTIKTMKGIYIPVFTFDSSTETKYTGRLGERETRTTSSKNGTSSYSYTRYYTISGDYNKRFDDLMVYASDKIPSNMMHDLEPFPTNESKVYDQKFIAGYSASTYSKEGKKAWEECKLRASQLIRKEILSGYSYDVVDYFNADTSYYNTSFKYVLIPLYVGHHVYNGKNYNYYVNGCTGKVTGRTPKSFIKILMLILAIIGVVSLPTIIMLLSNLY